MIDRKTMFNLVYTLQASAISDAYDDAMQNRGWYPIESYEGGDWVYVFVPNCIGNKFSGYKTIEACYMIGLKQWHTREGVDLKIKPTHWRNLFEPPLYYAKQ
jgi:hypothetical protein